MHQLNDIQKGRASRRQAIAPSRAGTPRVHSGQTDRNANASRIYLFRHMPDAAAGYRRAKDASIFSLTSSIGASLNLVCWMKGMPRGCAREPIFGDSSEPGRIVEAADWISVNPRRSPA